MQRLTFGTFFDHPITAGVLPSSLQQLTLGNNFNHPITAGVLPSYLQKIIFYSKYQLEICMGQCILTSLLHIEFHNNDYEDEVHE